MIHQRKRGPELDETPQAESRAKRVKAAQPNTAESSVHSVGPGADDQAVPSSSLGTVRIVPDHHAAQETADHLKAELQLYKCISARYRFEEIQKCTACISKLSGESCRFQRLRFILRNGDNKITGYSFGEGLTCVSPALVTPTKWNTDLRLAHIDYVKRSVARALLPVLKEELQHIKLPGVIPRSREIEVRATCDACLTSIFSSSWMCRSCGREACLDCFAYIRDGTKSETPPESRGKTSPPQESRQAHRDPFHLPCSNRHPHQLNDFSPVSRFCETELAQTIEDMEALLNSPAAAPPIPSEGSASNIRMSPARTSLASENDSTPSVLLPATSEPIDLPTSIPAPLSSSLPEPPPPSPAPSGAPIPSHDTTTISNTELTEEIFRRVWSRGDPLVATGLLDKFRIQWTPEYFSRNYGGQTCTLVECQSEDRKQETVSRFFSRFGNYADRRGLNWKLKDWPPSADFKTTFPELYDDFVRVTPVPNYVRRDGVLNIASHFPTNAVGPDLGPKMYNALASFESKGSKGSTRLHLDMADAINIMTYAESPAPSPAPDPDPDSDGQHQHQPTTGSGCAAWDIFKATDTPKLRAFLRQKFFAGKPPHGLSATTDPIHAQLFYLDEELRRELWKECGVVSHRIYQRPGEAVFIPAGCAHQVCNLADCIKVACDFVSPENVGRCAVLTREFREQNELKAWKEDVLQLRTMMWYAWLSCVKRERAMDLDP